jgi:hypothetical protein
MYSRTRAGILENPCQVLCCGTRFRGNASPGRPWGVGNRNNGIDKGGEGTSNPYHSPLRRHVGSKQASFPHGQRNGCSGYLILGAFPSSLTAVKLSCPGTSVNGTART